MNRKHKPLCRSVEVSVQESNSLRENAVLWSNGAAADAFGSVPRQQQCKQAAAAVDVAALQPLDCVVH